MTRNTLHALLAAAVMAAVPAIASAATIPYTENFDDDATSNLAPSEPAPESGTFAEANDDRWEVVDAGGGDNTYRANASGNDNGGRAVISTLDFGSTFATDPTFTMSADFNVNSFDAGSGGSTTVGFGALGTSAGFANGAYFLTDFFWDTTSDTGKVRIVEFDSGQNDTALDTSTDAVSIEANDNYRLTLTGVDNGADLDLTLTVENLTEGESASVNVPDATRLTGGHFGFRNAIATGTIAALDAEFDNFEIVPEPATLALLGLGGAVILAGRRRR